MRHRSLQKIRSTKGTGISLGNLCPPLRGCMNYLQSFRVEIPILSVRLQLLQELEESARGLLRKTPRIEMLIQLSPVRDFFVKPSIGDCLFHLDDAFEKPLRVRKLHSPDCSTKLYGCFRGYAELAARTLYSTVWV
jgi:hypothetical protein